MAFTKQRRNPNGNPQYQGNVPPVQGNNAMVQQPRQWNGNQGNQYQPFQQPVSQAPNPNQMPQEIGVRMQTPVQQNRPDPRYQEPNNQRQAQSAPQQNPATGRQANQGQPRQQQTPQNGQHNAGGQQGYQSPHHQTQNQTAPQYQQQNDSTAGQAWDAPAPESPTKVFVSTQIWNVNARDKVVDFSSRLTKAEEKDFANIHGIGGSGHAPNSTICVTICDYTKGKGNNSVTVKYGIDVEDIEILYYAAMAARLGLLRLLPPMQTGNSSCLFAYSKQKNNPHSTSKINGIEFAPVSQIGIYYDPSRNYPWIIHITNFDAPIIKQASGGNAHKSSQAVNKKEADICISADDFCASMTAARRFIRLWEQRMYRIVDAGCRKYEEAIEDLKKRNKKTG